MAGTEKQPPHTAESVEAQAKKALEQQAFEQEGQQVAAYFIELQRRVNETSEEQIKQQIAHKQKTFEIAQALKAAEEADGKKIKAPAKLSWLRKHGHQVLAVVVTVGTLVVSIVSIASTFPLWTAIALIGLTTISSQGIIRLIDSEETFASTPLPTQPLSDLYHTIVGKNPEKKAAAWERFKQSFPQVTGALTVGIAVGWATLTQLGSGGLLPIPLPAAILLAVAVGIWNYGLGAGSFAPAQTTTGKSVTFVGKLKDYWHQFKIENNWEKALRVLGHGFALGVGLALLGIMTAGTGGAFFYLALAAGTIQLVGLQRTNVPHMFVRMGATLLRPFGVKINTPKNKFEWAWSRAPKKTKVITLLGVSIAMSTTAYLLIQGFAAVGIFASIGFPPAAAAVVTAVFLGVLSYQLLQRFYFSRLPAKKQKYFEDMAYADERQDALKRTNSKKVTSMLDLEQQKEARSKKVGWTASKTDVLEERFDYFLTQDLATMKQIKTKEMAATLPEAPVKSSVKSELDAGSEDETSNPFSFKTFEAQQKKPLKKRKQGSKDHKPKPPVG